jgi:Glycosyltransferase family 87
MPTDGKSPTFWGRIAAGLAVVFALLNIVNALNKGGDAAVFFEGGRRFLALEPLYEGSSAAAGFIGPPFQAMFFAPLAWVAEFSPLAAKLLWHSVNVVCLVAGVWYSARAWWAVREQLGLPPKPWLPYLFAPLAAVLLPLQTNFEHQNMNTVLLALVAGATCRLTMGSAIAAGILVGAASALKAFPGLIVIYLAVRRQWHALAAALATALLLTILPALFYGAEAYQNLLTAFLRLGNSGWPVRGNNQSLVAAIDRYLSGFSATGVRSAVEAPLAATLFAGAALLLGTLLLVVLLRTRSTPAFVPSEIAAVSVLAILLSPIAWDHYWTLLFPAFVILYESGDARLLGSTGRYAFWIGAALTTALSPITLGGRGFNAARELSVDTAAGVLVYVALLAMCVRRRTRKRQD